MESKPLSGKKFLAGFAIAVMVFALVLYLSRGPQASDMDLQERAELIDTILKKSRQLPQIRLERKHNVPAPSTSLSTHTGKVGPGKITWLIGFSGLQKIGDIVHYSGEGNIFPYESEDFPPEYWKRPPDGLCKGLNTILGRDYDLEDLYKGIMFEFEIQTSDVETYGIFEFAASKCLNR